MYICEILSNDVILIIPHPSSRWCALLPSSFLIKAGIHSFSVGIVLLWPISSSGVLWRPSYPIIFITLPAGGMAFWSICFSPMEPEAHPSSEGVVSLWPYYSIKTMMSKYSYHSSLPRQVVLPSDLCPSFFYRACGPFSSSRHSAPTTHLSYFYFGRFIKTIVSKNSYHPCDYPKPMLHRELDISGYGVVFLYYFIMYVPVACDNVITFISGNSVKQYYFCYCFLFPITICNFSCYIRNFLPYQKRNTTFISRKRY